MKLLNSLKHWAASYKFWGKQNPGRQGDDSSPTAQANPASIKIRVDRAGADVNFKYTVLNEKIDALSSEIRNRITELSASVNRVESARQQILQEAADIRRRIESIGDAAKTSSTDSVDNGDGGGGGSVRNGGGSGNSDGGNGNDGGEGGRSTAGGGRFWENYAIRYLGGTFVAGAGLLVLFGVPASGLHELMTDLKDSLDPMTLKDYQSVLIFLLIGTAFTYSYIASAPIYLLHLFRVMLFQISPEKSEKEIKRYKGSLLLLPLAGILTVAAWFTADLVNSGPVICPRPLAAVIWGGFLILLVVQWAVVFRFFLSTDYLLVRFYKRLAQTRALRGVQGDFMHEYVESYRHLREHGNAFLVILMNIALTSILFIAPSLLAAVWIIALWTAPAVCGWFAATLLEMQTQTKEWPKDVI